MAYSKEWDNYGEMAEFYDNNEAYRHRTDVKFFVEAAFEAKGPVLEVGCGTGRVLIPTARAGVAITGLDFSKNMLAQCAKKLTQEAAEVQSRVNLVHGDMREFKLDRTFALATIPFRPFQHLETVEDQIKCLRCIHRHLAPDGRLILDIFNPYMPALVDPKRSEENEVGSFTTADGRKVVRKDCFTVDVFQQISHVQLIYYVTHPGGHVERIVNKFPMRYLFRYEAEHLLVRCGFEIEHLYSDYDKSAFGMKCPGELIFVARKV
jgi:SAM-dependent methyltransferase